MSYIMIHMLCYAILSCYSYVICYKQVCTHFVSRRWRHAMERPWVVDSAQWFASLITVEEAWGRMVHHCLKNWEQMRWGSWMVAILKRMGCTGAQAIEAIHIFRRECYELERWHPR